MQGKVAIVTGGSSGIGRATAIAFAKAGAKVVVAARRTQAGEETVRLAKDASGEAIFVQTDVTKASDVENLIHQTLQAYDRLDYAFNNAGSGKPGAIADLSEEDWDYEIDSNLKSIWLCMKYEIPAMQKSGGGAIVNMSSQGALLGVANYGAYGAASSILLLCDSGGSNSSRQYLFKQDLQALVNELGIEIRIAHYPPYTSKYNPIEHRLFPHLTRVCQGVIFDSVEMVKDLMAKAKTHTGLRVLTTVLERVYKTGRQVTENFKQTMEIVFDDYLPQWNYTAKPQRA
jgi:Rhodopirellula transposase DDE domain/short chain dehydrogenase